MFHGGTLRKRKTLTLTLPNVSSIEVDFDSLGSAAGGARWRNSRVFSRNTGHQDTAPALATPHVSHYPWLARFHWIRSIYLTDYLSRAEGETTERASFLRRAIARVANWPLTNLIAVSGFNARECAAGSLASPSKIIRIYNGVDLSRANEETIARLLWRDGTAFRTDAANGFYR